MDYSQTDVFWDVIYSVWLTVRSTGIRNCSIVIIFCADLRIAAGRIARWVAIFYAITKTKANKQTLWQLTVEDSQNWLFANRFKKAKKSINLHGFLVFRYKVPEGGVPNSYIKQIVRYFASYIPSSSMTIVSYYGIRLAMPSFGGNFF